MSFLFNKQTRTADDKSIPYVSGNNVFLDDMPLLEKNSYGRMQPREKSTLNKLFSHFYHCEVEIGPRLERSLVSMAEAINNDRQALAAIMLVHLNLPCREMVVKYNPNHVPAGNSGAGQFTSGNDTGTQVSQEVFPPTLLLDEPPVIVRPPFEQLPEDPTVPPGPGYVWKGKGEPGGPQGGWDNEDTGESLHPDMQNEKEGPHWDYTKYGRKYRWYPDGTLVPKTIVGPIL